MEIVRAVLGDGVDAAAGEPALADVVRRDHQLKLLDRIEADRLCFRGAARRASRAGQAEQVVVRGAVDLKAVVTEAGSRDRHDRRAVARAAAHRIEHRVDADDVRDAPLNRGQSFLDFVGDVVGRAGDRTVDERALPDDLYRLGNRLELHLEVHGFLLAEADRNLLRPSRS